MREPITVIRPHLIDNYTRIIQSLARGGRLVYHRYLIEPIQNWPNAVMPQESLERLNELIHKAKRERKKNLPLLYKMAIVRSVAPDRFDLAVPGNLSLAFLKEMKTDDRVMTSDEAREFVNLLRDPFKEFSDREFVRLNKKFEEEIASADRVEVEELIRMREGEDEARMRLEEEVRKSADEILAMVPHNNLADIKRRITVFLIKFAEPSVPNLHAAIDQAFTALQRHHPKIQKEVMDSAAVIIYHEILKAIQNNDLRKAISYLGKYAVLFRGDPTTPNYREVDSFEKKFFTLIEERNLWERLREE